MKKESFIYGTRPAIEAIKANKEIEKLFIQKGLRSEQLGELMALIKEREIPYQYVPVEKLNRISRKNHQGIIVYLSEIEYQDIENIIQSAFEKGEDPSILILDKITDVRNFGAIARTAECCGVNALIVPAKGSAQINADAIKTSAGALHKIPVHRSNNLKDTIKYLKDSGLQIIACTEKAEKIYTSGYFTKPTAIIVGSEDSGVSPEYLKLCDQKVKIPILGSIESLNVSVACGVILYEMLRQKSDAKTSL